jgi:hypothetical protein
MNYPAASGGVSKTERNEASFGKYDPERFNALRYSCYSSFYAFPMRATKKTAAMMNNMATAILTGVRSVPGRY